MAKDYVITGIRLTTDERSILEQKASELGVSLSKYIKQQLDLDTLKALNEFSVEDVPSENELRTNTYTIRLTDTEKEQIEKEAELNNVPPSVLIRNKALSAKKIIKIDVFDDDVKDLEFRIVPKMNIILGNMKALSMQTKLHDVQIEKMMSILTEINSDFKFIVNRIRTNRNKLKVQRTKELAKRVDNAIATETNSLATFKAEEDLL